MALGDYSKTTYVNGTSPAINAARLNNTENKVKELDTAAALSYTFLGTGGKKIASKVSEVVLAAGAINVQVLVYLPTGFSAPPVIVVSGHDYVFANNDLKIWVTSVTSTQFYFYISKTTANAGTVNLNWIAIGS